MIYASTLSVPDFFLIETDNSKALNNVKLNNTMQVESVSSFTAGAVYLAYVSLGKENCTLQYILFST